MLTLRIKLLTVGYIKRQRGRLISLQINATNVVITARYGLHQLADG
jgi:hypothetical protein